MPNYVYIPRQLYGTNLVIGGMVGITGMATIHTRDAIFTVLVIMFYGTLDVYLT